MTKRQVPPKVGDVDGAQALAEIKRLSAGGQIQWRYHAVVRMASRGATRADVRRAIGTATSARWQTDHQSWIVAGGVDLDGDSLRVAVAIEADLIIITIF